MPTPKLFMLLLGCRPKGRFTEQHDVLFSIGNDLPALLPDIAAFWPDGGKIHIDAWREVTKVDGFSIRVVEKNAREPQAEKLFFINLGGYKESVFEEYHYKLLAIGKEKSMAIKTAKETAFYQHMGVPGADSHIDDKYGIDIDDLYLIEEILPKAIKKKYAISISPAVDAREDKWHLGYTKLSSLQKNS